MLPLAAWRLTSDTGIGDIVLCLMFLTPFLKTAGHALPPEGPVLVNPLADRPVLRQALAGTEPIVITGGVDYLWLWYYAASDQKERAIYLGDPADEMKVTGDDTVDRGFLALGRWTPVPVRPAEAFFATHRQFLMYRFPPEWLPEALTRAGASIEPLDRDERGELVRVTLPR